MILVWKVLSSLDYILIRTGLVHFMGVPQVKAKKKKKLNTDPFSYIEGDELISDNEVLRNGAASWYKLIQVLSIIGIVIGLIGCFCGLAIQKPSKREELKGSITAKCFIFFLICIFVFLLNQMIHIAKEFI